MAKGDWAGATDVEVQLLQAGQSNCALCGEPFMYWPVKQEVTLHGDRDLYVHKVCADRERHGA